MLLTIKDFLYYPLITTTEIYATPDTIMIWGEIEKGNDHLKLTVKISDEKQEELSTWL